MTVSNHSILQEKRHREASIFQPENLLREARRQRNIAPGEIPKICLLDPDGDILDYLIRTEQAALNPYWAGYHTKLYQFKLKGIEMGIIGCAVGASFAVLLAEQMFVSGCQLLISVTSAGIINPPKNGERFILIDKALRDEGTSYHYLPPREVTALETGLLTQLQSLISSPNLSLGVGDSWTTDAPYRETQSAFDRAKSKGITAVEMEAAALYAFAQAKNKNVICFAHLTNTMAQAGKDFEKGLENGSLEALELIYQTVMHMKFKS